MIPARMAFIFEDESWRIILPCKNVQLKLVLLMDKHKKTEHRYIYDH